MNESEWQAAKEAWDKSIKTSDSIGFVGTVLLIGGIAVFLLPLVFTKSLPEWTIVPASVAGVGLLLRVVSGLWPHPDLPDKPPSPQEVARRAREQRESLPDRLVLARSTDTSQIDLRNLAQNDPSPEVRRAAIETLALLRQAGF